MTDNRVEALIAESEARLDAEARRERAPQVAQARQAVPEAGIGDQYDWDGAYAAGDMPRPEGGKLKTPNRYFKPGARVMAGTDMATGRHVYDPTPDYEADAYSWAIGPLPTRAEGAAAWQSAGRVGRAIAEDLAAKGLHLQGLDEAAEALPRTQLTENEALVAQSALPIGLGLAAAPYLAGAGLASLIAGEAALAGLTTPLELNVGGETVPVEGLFADLPDGAMRKYLNASESVEADQELAAMAQNAVEGGAIAGALGGSVVGFVALARWAKRSLRGTQDAIGQQHIDDAVEMLRGEQSRIDMEADVQALERQIDEEVEGAEQVGSKKPAEQGLATQPVYSEQTERAFRELAYGLIMRDTARVGPRADDYAPLAEFMNAAEAMGMPLEDATRIWNDVSFDEFGFRNPYMLREYPDTIENLSVFDPTPTFDDYVEQLPPLNMDDLTGDLETDMGLIGESYEEWLKREAQDPAAFMRNLKKGLPNLDPFQVQTLRTMGLIDTKMQFEGLSLDQMTEEEAMQLFRDDLGEYLSRKFGWKKPDG